MGGTGLDGLPFKVFTNDTTVTDPLRDPTSGAIIRPPLLIQGFRLQDARASYGLGIETFALGFPIHLDWSYCTLFNQDSGKLPLRQQRAVAQAEVQRVDRVRLLGSSL